MILIISINLIKSTTSTKIKNKRSRKGKGKDKMKKKILALILILGLAFCFVMTGCTFTGSKDYESHSKLVAIEGENDLYYYSTTHIVYIVFNEYAASNGYGYMSPYYSENGKLCTYDVENKKIVEIGE